MDSSRSSIKHLFEKNSGDSRDVHVESRSSNILSHNSSVHDGINSLNSPVLLNPRGRLSVQKRNLSDLGESARADSRIDKDSRRPSNQHLFGKNSGNSTDVHVESRSPNILSLNSSTHDRIGNLNSPYQLNPRKFSSFEKRTPIDLEAHPTFAAETKAKNSVDNIGPARLKLVKRSDL